MEIDRRAFIASLGGAAAVNLMDHEAKAEALEHYMEDKLDELVAAQQPPKYPSVAELEAEIETRTSRRGVGGLFVGRRGENVMGSSRVDLQACKLEYSIVSPK